MSFTELGLIEPLVRAVEEKGYTEPSPIQAQGIPAVLKGGDVMAAAQTGTGKTAGFTLPLLQRLVERDEREGRQARVAPNHCRALVLTPTRELAAQVGESVQAYSRYLRRIKSTVVFGGVKINPQIAHLRGGVDVLVATPGRLLDLHQQGAIHFDQLEVLVLDEADRMLDMGFIHDIRRILKLLPVKRQNLLYSATFSGEIRTLAEGLLDAPVQIDVSPRNSTAKTVTQWLHPVDKSSKTALLCHLVHEHNWQQVLVFTRTKHGANRLAQKLEKDGISAAAIHGNKSQGARTRALADFKRGTIRVLVATDIAARGLDIEQLPQVVNFELPNVAEDYVHRIGRTGRAGSFGKAISLVSADEAKSLFGIEKLIGRQVERRDVYGFEPQHSLPESARGINKLDSDKPRRRRKPQRTDGSGQKRGAAKPQRNSDRHSERNSRTDAKPHSNGAKPAANNRPKRRRNKPSNSTHAAKSARRGGGAGRPKIGL